MSRDPRYPAPGADPDAAPDPTLPPQAVKGRGAVSNRPGRYELGERPLEDDGWRNPVAEDPEADLPPLRTTVLPDTSRSVIARNQSPDVPFDQSINPYRGCEHVL